MNDTDYSELAFEKQTYQNSILLSNDYIINYKFGEGASSNSSDIEYSSKMLDLYMNVSAKKRLKNSYH